MITGCLFGSQLSNRYCKKMKIYDTKPLIFAFQRQALLTVNILPGFGETTFWKYCLICFTPLLVLYLAFYLIAFSPDSLGIIIFSTGKVNIHKLLCGVSLLEQDTIENVSQPKDFSTESLFYLGFCDCSSKMSDIS